MIAPDAAADASAPLAGFVALTRMDDAALKTAGGRAELMLGSGGEGATSLNRLLHEPRLGFLEATADHLPLDRLEETALDLVAEQLWRPWAEAVADQTRPARRRIDLSVGPEPETAVLVALSGSRPVRELLSYLELAHGDRLHVLFVAPEAAADDVAAAVVASSPPGSVSVLPTVAPTYALNIRAGLKEVGDLRLVVLSDSIVPPARPWATDLADGETLTAPVGVDRFDGGALRWTPPSSVSGLPRRGCLQSLENALSSGFGVVGGPAGALATSESSWAVMTSEAGFWATVLQRAQRRRFSADVRFTYAPRERARPDPAQLIDAALLRRLERNAVTEAAA